MAVVLVGLVDGLHGGRRVGVVTPPAAAALLGASATILWTPAQQRVQLNLCSTITAAVLFGASTQVPTGDQPVLNSSQQFFSPRYGDQKPLESEMFGPVYKRKKGPHLSRRSARFGTVDSRSPSS